MSRCLWCICTRIHVYTCNSIEYIYLHDLSFPTFFFLFSMTRIFCFFPFFSVSARYTSKRNMGTHAILLENVVFWSSLSVYVDSWIRMHYFPVKNSSDRFWLHHVIQQAIAFRWIESRPLKPFQKASNGADTTKGKSKHRRRVFTIERPAFVARGSSV